MTDFYKYLSLASQKITKEEFNKNNNKILSLASKDLRGQGDIRDYYRDFIYERKVYPERCPNFDLDEFTISVLNYYLQCEEIQADIIKNVMISLDRYKDTTKEFITDFVLKVDCDISLFGYMQSYKDICKFDKNFDILDKFLSYYNSGKLSGFKIFYSSNDCVEYCNAILNRLRFKEKPIKTSDYGYLFKEAIENISPKNGMLVFSLASEIRSLDSNVYFTEEGLLITYPIQD